MRLYVRKWVDILLQKGTPQINVSPEGSTNIWVPEMICVAMLPVLLFLSVSYDSHFGTSQSHRGSQPQQWRRSVRDKHYQLYLRTTPAMSNHITVRLYLRKCLHIVLRKEN